MTVGAISSISLYEYYYKLNNPTRLNRKTTVEKEMEKYGLVPTDDLSVNVRMLEKAKQIEGEAKTASAKSEENYYDRPWADIMYQLNLSFNEDPQDDIRDIKEELNRLAKNLDDKDMKSDINDLEDYVEELYLDYEQSSLGISSKSYLQIQMQNLSTMNIANIM